VDGAVTKLWSTGTTTLKATDTMAAAYIMAGDFDLTKGAGIRTVTSIWKTVQARLHYRPDTDAVTVYTIGNP